MGGAGGGPHFGDDGPSTSSGSFVEYASIAERLVMTESYRELYRNCSSTTLIFSKSFERAGVVMVSSVPDCVHSA